MVALPADIDPVVVGAQSGLLWAGDELTLAGIGEVARVPIERPAGAAEAQRALSDLDPGSAQTVEPGHSTVGFCALAFDRTEPGELIVPSIVVGCDASGTRWLSFVDGSSDSALDEVREFASTPADPPDTTGREVSSVISGDRWRDEVVAVSRDRIRSGELSKAVLAREIVVDAGADIDVAEVVLGLHERFVATNIFAVDGFVGASPELLVARTGQVVRAHPLAGTMPKRRDPVADQATIAALIASTKNQWEHRITIDWLLDTLLPFCSYVDAEPEPTVVSLANVHHLGTRVQGVLSAPPASVLELAAALHPTPAVGGDPQATALRLISEVEPGDRGRYAGAVGWVDAAGNGAFAVAIRSAEIAGPTARVWAGVGVVADSDPQAELEETEAKFQAVLSVLLGSGSHTT